MSATPQVKRKADTEVAEGTENKAFESEEDDSEPSEDEDGPEGQGAFQGQGAYQGHPAVVITPSLERATEEAIQILDASLPPSPDEEKKDPFVVAADVHAANG